MPMTNTDEDWKAEDVEKKVERSVDAGDLWDSMPSVVKKFNNLIKRKV